MSQPLSASYPQLNPVPEQERFFFFTDVRAAYEYEKHSRVTIRLKIIFFPCMLDTPFAEIVSSFRNELGGSFATQYLYPLFVQR